MNFKTSDFRKKLKQTYNIDHIVELQILVAILLENEIYDISICSDFTNCFNESWNLQVVTKGINKNKSELVLEYIRWKFDAKKTEEVKKNVLDEIFKISKVYNENRNLTRNCLKSKQNSNVYLKLENSLYNFLNDTSKKHQISISIDQVITESDGLQQELSKLNNIDHIIELQLLTHVLTTTKVNSEDSALIFIKCFHEFWNFQVMSKSKNNSKGQMVKKWINAVENKINLNNNEVNEQMKFIFNHYKGNINDVKTNIISNKTINNEVKQQLCYVADELLKLFQKNIS